MKKWGLLLLIIFAVLLIVWQLSSELLTSVIAGVIVVSGIYLVRRAFDSLEVNGKVMGVLKPWSELSAEQRFVRELWMGIPLTLLAFLLTKSPVMLLIGLIGLLAATNHILKHRKNEKDNNT
ncbi:MAG: hypothetical protein KJ069_12105 [Anaerolineae bacterium]|nr:hypothetical protein [Anaerolineae bacterium]